MSKEDQNVIEIKNVTKEYKMFARKKDRLMETIFPKYSRHSIFKAIDNMNLEIKKGEVLGILGKNGAGKSTLLKMITGVVTPTSGEIIVKGKISSLLELGTSFNPDLTGIENIYQHGQVMGLENYEIKRKEQSIIDFADIGEHLYQPVKTYSSGMFARLAFACAIHVNPDILIVDEVLSVGDITFQLKCIKHMKKMIQDGVTILYVSHSPETVMSLCTRAMWLIDGRIHEIGDVREVSKKYSVFMTHGYISKKDQENVESLEEKMERFDDIDVKKSLQSGNKKAQIEKVKYSLIKNGSGIVEKWEKEQQITFLVKVKENVENPMFGMTINNTNGLPIYHFNSYALKSKITPLEAGKKYEIKLSFHLPKLNNGKYSLSIGLDDGMPGLSDIVHRLDNVFIYDVIIDSNDKQFGIVYIENTDVEMVEK